MSKASYIVDENTSEAIVEEHDSTTTNEEEIYDRLRDAVDDSKYFDETRLIEALKNTPPELMKQAADCSRVSGNEAFKRGNHQEALQLYSQAIIGDPNDARTYANRAMCLLALDEPMMALRDSMTATQKDEKYSKGFYRKGCALAILDCPGEAVKAFQEALRLAPNDVGVKKALGEQLFKKRESDAVKRLQAQAMAGAEIEEHQKKGMSEAEAIQKAEASLKEHEKNVGLEESVPIDGSLFRPSFSEDMLISTWREAPTGKLKANDLMGNGIHKLVQMRTELLSPARLIEACETLAPEIELAASEVIAAVEDKIKGGKSSPTVLCVGSGACVLPIVAARAGAKVLVLEPSMFLASILSQTAHMHGLKDSIDVGHMSAEDCDWTDSHVVDLIPFDIICFSVGLSKFSVLSERIIPAFKKIRPHLSPTGIIMPRKVTTKAVLLEMHLAKDVNSLTLSVFDQYLWSHGETCVNIQNYPHTSLTDTFVLFEMDLMSNTLPTPTTDLGETLTITAHTSGIFNAIVCLDDIQWYKSKKESVNVCKAKRDVRIQYLNNVTVSSGEDITLAAIHNTTRLWIKQKTILQKESQKNKRTCPEGYIDSARDLTRLNAYSTVIQKSISKVNRARVLGIGDQLGIVGISTLKNGAHRFSAIDGVDHVCETARAAARKNGVKGYRFTSTDVRQVSDMNHEKYDVIVAETIDNGAIGEGILHFIEHARENLLKENGTVIPLAITIRAVLVERKMNPIANVDLNSLNRYFWSPDYIAIDLDKSPTTKVLTVPANVFHFDLRKTGSFQPAASPFVLRVVDKGTANAIAFFFRLWFDEESYIDTAPSCVVEMEKRVEKEALESSTASPLSVFVKPGSVNPVSLEYEKEENRYWTQGITYFSPIDVESGETVRFMAEHDKSSLKFVHVPKTPPTINPKTDPDGEWIEMFKHVSEINRKISENIDADVNEFGNVAKKAQQLAGQSAWFRLHPEDALQYSRLFL